MRNEPVAIANIREYLSILDANKNKMGKAKHIYLYSISKDARILLEYIDQLQGLLDGTLMCNSYDQIVSRVSLESQQVGDYWYSPVTYRGFQSAITFNGKDDDETNL